MIEPSHGLGNRSKMKELSVDESTGDRSNIGDDDGVMPLSGDKPFFDMVLTQSAVKPRYHIVRKYWKNKNVSIFTCFKLINNINVHI